MRKSTLLILAIIASAFSYAQSRIVSGSVLDTSGSPLPSITVNLKSSAENLSVKTNAQGKFQFASVSATDFIITITGTGYNTFVQSYTVGSNSGKAFLLDPIQMKIKTTELAEVVITVNPITIKEDTIEYRADAYKVQEGAPVEDVLKKLPGVSVDKDGVVTAQGKEVKRVRVNGKDYFGGDVITATQNLPADVIESIQIIDDYGDKANQTGIKEGEPEKILNFNVKRGMNKGSFGNGTAGVGTDDRYLLRVNANNFKESRQISFIGSLNNTNANSFNFNGGGRGGGARGMNFGGGGGERGGFGGDGTTLSTSLGLNYRDDWSKKITSYGSYSFSSRDNNTNSTTYSTDIDTTRLRTSLRTNSSHTTSYNHRLTWNIEYKIDSQNYVKVTPYFSYSTSNGSSSSLSDITALKYGTTYYTHDVGSSNSSSTSPAYGGDLFYIHRFARKGRNFNISASLNYSDRNQDRSSYNTYHDSSSRATFATDSISNQIRKTNSSNTSSNVRFSFAEPIGKYTALEASYTYNNSKTVSLQDVNIVDNITGIKFKSPTQSNDYEYEFTTHRFGLNLHTNKPKYNYYVGVVAQPSKLQGVDRGRKFTTTNTGFNIMPNARFAYNFSRSHSLTATYGGSSREPSFTQLQPISDSTNIKNIVTGNPDLKAEFTNRFSLQYNKVGILTGTSFFANLSFDETQNKIVTSRADQDSGTGRTTTYLNTNGFYGFNGNVSMTQPFAKKKLAATLGISGSFDNNLSFLNKVMNKGQNWTIRPNARLRIDITNIVDLNLSASLNYNKSTVHYPTYTRIIGGNTFTFPEHTTSTEVKNYTFGLEGKNFFFKSKYTLGYDINKIIYQGYNSLSTNPTLLNVYVERRFLKNNKGTLRFQAFDIFDQNTGISRDVNGTTTTDTRSERLGRYFLLTFNLRLQKFAGRQFNRMPGDRMNNPNGGFRNGGGGMRNPGGGGGGGGRRQ